MSTYQKVKIYPLLHWETVHSSTMECFGKKNHFCFQIWPTLVCVNLPYSREPHERSSCYEAKVNILAENMVLMLPFGDKLDCRVF